MGFLDRLKKGVMAALNDTTTSDELAGQIEGLAPTGILGRRRTAKDHAELEGQEEAIGQGQRRIDDLTLQGIKDDWKDISESFSRNKELMTLTVGDRTFWKRDISRRIWQQNLQAINTDLRNFLRTHSKDIQDIAYRDYPCFSGHSDVETRKWHKAVFRDIDHVAADIASSIESMIPMRDNQGLDFQSQTDPAAARKLYGFCTKIDTLIYNYKCAIDGMQELVGMH